jgi:hypothetical protein
MNAPEGRQPMPTPETPRPPKDIQQRLDEHFGHLNLTAHWLEPRVEPAPKPKRSPEELQQALEEAFGGDAARAALDPSPRAVRALQRSLRLGSRAKPAPGRARRKRCDAWVKQLSVISKKTGVRVTRGPRCRGWALESGRCRVHGGLSTGPRTPEGKARSVAAKQEGRFKWIARVQAEGGVLPFGRKTGEAWVTEPMRERARAEAHRLGAKRFTLDKALVLALLGSAKGDHVRQAKAKAMLDAQELAAMSGIVRRGPGEPTSRASRPTCAQR